MLIAFLWSIFGACIFFSAVAQSAEWTKKYSRRQCIELVLWLSFATALVVSVFPPRVSLPSIIIFFLFLQGRKP